MDQPDKFTKREREPSLIRRATPYLLGSAGTLATLGIGAAICIPSVREKSMEIAAPYFGGPEPMAPTTEISKPDIKVKLFEQTLNNPHYHIDLILSSQNSISELRLLGDKIEVKYLNPNMPTETIDLSFDGKPITANSQENIFIHLAASPTPSAPLKVISKDNLNARNITVSVFENDGNPQPKVMLDLAGRTRDMRMGLSAEGVALDVTGAGNPAITKIPRPSHSVNTVLLDNDMFLTTYKGSPLTFNGKEPAKTEVATTRGNLSR